MQGHPLDRCKWITNKYAISKAIDASENEHVRMVGMVSELRQFKTKKKTDMAIFFLADKCDRIKCVVFSKTYASVNHHLEENAILYVEGKKSDREGEIIVNRVNDTSRMYKRGVSGAELKGVIDPGVASRVKQWLEKQEEANLNGTLPFSLELAGLNGVVEIEASQRVSELLLTEMDAKLAGLDFKWTK